MTSAAPKSGTAMPRVSVVVCTYNNAATLARSLESLAAQDYPNFHVVVVDDCSTDNSVAIAQEYAAKHPVIRSVKNEHNLGLVGNYSSAYRFIEGEFFMHGGPDDTWEPNFLSEMVRLLTNNPRAAAALSSVNSSFDDGETEVFRYPEINTRFRDDPWRLSLALINGVSGTGDYSSPYNSFIHAVVRSRYFRAVFPNDETYWYVELQIVIMYALLGGLATIEQPLYTRHRFRKTWAERYPDDKYVPAGVRPWSRFRSAIRFAVLAFACDLLPARAKRLLPGIFLATVLFQVIRPAVTPHLARFLPPSLKAKIRLKFYRLVSHS